MANLRMLCERYIQIDDKTKELSQKIDNETDITKKQELTAKYLQLFMEKEDFKSGMRRHLINELIDGIIV